jgi:hypothetical protein
MSTTTRRFALALLGLGLGLPAPPAFAQFAGHNLKGDNGLLSASQPPPGFYLVGSYLNYASDSLRDADGNPIALDPQRRSELVANGYFVPTLLWVSKAKVLGAPTTGSWWPRAS